MTADPETQRWWAIMMPSMSTPMLLLAITFVALTQHQPLEGLT